MLPSTTRCHAIRFWLPLKVFIIAMGASPGNPVMPTPSADGLIAGMFETPLDVFL